jgi:hypothetical protein
VFKVDGKLCLSFLFRLHNMINNSRGVSLLEGALFMLIFTPFLLILFSISSQIYDKYLLDSAIQEELLKANSIDSNSQGLKNSIGEFQRSINKRFGDSYIAFGVIELSASGSGENISCLNSQGSISSCTRSNPAYLKLIESAAIIKQQKAIGSPSFEIQTNQLTIEYSKLRFFHLNLVIPWENTKTGKLLSKLNINQLQADLASSAYTVLRKQLG